MRSLSRRVAVLAFPGAQVLDVTGPHEVFSRTERLLREQGRTGTPAYKLEVLATEAGPMSMSSGLRLFADRAWRDERGVLDTLVIAGGLGVQNALGDRALLRWLKRISARVRRLCSVCTGAFLLAEAELLDGRRATTHWSACARLAERYPHVRVEAEPIFVRDGSVYTSAGVTAGMDLALALVEEDWGQAVALAVARELVLFLKRPGNQAQFSAQLSAQAAEQPRLQRVQAFVADHPDADLSVSALARRAAMSERTFARSFADEVGQTPARYVERARIDAACRTLLERDLGLESVASRCGFGSAEVMRRAFVRTLGVPPASYRNRFRTTRTLKEERA
jgi:transcriptional regulator GlxA family with amidase domain